MSGKRRKGIEAAMDAYQSSVDPLDRLGAARRIREAAERIEDDAADQARAAGHTWAEIGAVFGQTKQGAQQRFQRRTDDAVKPRRRRKPTTPNG